MVEHGGPYREGDESKAICHHCKKISPTIFQIRDVPMKKAITGLKNNVTVNGILVAVCHDCDKVVAIPQQSVPQIKAALDKYRKKK